LSCQLAAPSRKQDRKISRDPFHSCSPKVIDAFPRRCHRRKRSSSGDHAPARIARNSYSRVEPRRPRLGGRSIAKTAGLALAIFRIQTICFSANDRRFARASSTPHPAIRSFPNFLHRSQTRQHYANRNSITLKRILEQVN